VVVAHEPRRADAAEMRRPLPALVIAGGLIAASLSSRRAEAYVRSVNSEQLPLRWSSSCETVTIYLNGFTAMTPDEVAKSIGGAAAAWGPDSVTCPADVGDGGNGHPYFEILPQLATGGSAPAAGTVGQNSIVFQTTAWDADVSPEALAFTRVARAPSGQIVDAVVEINAANPEIVWANLDPGAPPPTHGQLRFDLQTVMTHEFGHFLGLAHTCLGGDSSDNGDSPPDGSEDSAGQLIPACTDPPDSSNATQAEAVMWYVIDSASIAKRVLTTDDARGVCAIYPSAQDPHSCTQNLPDDGCGCATAGAPSGALAAVALAATALVTRRRRRRRC
jgi:MYXO-CTERM domain-containing protein